MASRRVLIVSPHFPPINAPDHQRIRMSLAHFQEFGWQPHVLSVHPDYVEGVEDCLLQQTIPADIQVTRTKALPINYTRKLGLGSLGLRCLPYFLQAGDRLLTNAAFDLVYFSTTMFPVMALGSRWRNKFGVPYILDFQDPWLSDYDYSQGIPPGGRYKYAFSQFLARNLEPDAVQNASHIISVSPEYPKILLKRYPNLHAEQFTVLPFGAAQQDFELLHRVQIKQTIFDPNDGKQHWVYVGRGGDDMAFAVRSLFLALAQQPQKLNHLQLHFIGTDYAPKDLARKTIEPIAYECGIANIVREYPQRIPYFEALQCLLDADALIVPGSDDPSYTASKIYPYILAQKPLLGIFHEQSSVVQVLQSTQAGTIVTFNTSDRPDNISQKIVAEWLQSSYSQKPTTCWQAFTRYTAREMTRQQCNIFNNSLNINPEVQSLSTNETSSWISP